MPDLSQSQKLGFLSLAHGDLVLWTPLNSQRTDAVTG